jgi:hypothetical protein
MKPSCLLLIGLILFSSCASSYNPVNVRGVVHARENANDISLGYRYDVLMDSRNKKYAKKENPLGIRVVAIEVTNESEEAVIFGQDVELYAGNLKAEILSPSQTVGEMRQQGGWYMFWSLLWLVITNCDDGDCSVIPLPIGVVIGLSNMSVAKGANRNFTQDLARWDLMGKSIAPGETWSGLVCIRVTGSPALTVKRATPER